MTVMTTANAAAAASGSEGETQEPVLLVALEVESKALALHEAEVRKLADEITLILERVVKADTKTPDESAEAGTKLTKAQRQCAQQVAVVEKLQLRIDGLRITKQQTEARDARRGLIERVGTLLQVADACEARVKAAKAILENVVEVHGLLAEYTPGDAGELNSETYLLFKRHLVNHRHEQVVQSLKKVSPSHLPNWQ